MKTPELIYHQRINLGHYASAGTISREGDVLVTAGGHDPFMMISRDRGTTFEIKKGINYPTTYGFTQLRDGTFISFGSNNVGHRALMDKRQKVVPFVLKIMRAKTFDDILDGRIDVSFAVVDIPDLTFGWGDSNNCHSGTVAQGCVELENGDIVVTTDKKPLTQRFAPILLSRAITSIFTAPGASFHVTAEKLSAIFLPSLTCRHIPYPI